MKALIACGFVTLLTACAGTTPPKLNSMGTKPLIAENALPSSVDTMPQPVAGFPSILPPISGRIAVRIQRDSNKPSEGGTSQFELQGDAQLGSLQLISPIGIPIAHAQWNQTGIEIKTIRETRQFSHIDELSQLWFKQPLPMAAFLTWLRGLPWSDAPHQATEQGFEQLGWRISNQHYSKGKLEMHRAPQPDDTNPTEIWLRAQLDPLP